MQVEMIKECGNASNGSIPNDSILFNTLFGVAPPAGVLAGVVLFTGVHPP